MAARYASQQPAGFNNHIKNVAIVGAGGYSGKHITEHLLKGGKHQITAISREDSQNPIADGVTIKRVNYDDHASLVSAMKGQDALIITMNVLAPPDSQNKLIAAATDAGVPWILPNEFGNNTDSPAAKEVLIGIGKAKVRQDIESRGVASWIGLACGFWYEFSLPGGDIRFGFDFPDKRFIMYEDGREKIDVSTWPQVGRAVAAVLSLPILPEDDKDSKLTLSHYRNKFVNFKSFTVDQRDMFASILRVTGDKESDWTMVQGSSKEAFDRGHKMLKEGNMQGFGLQLYARGFFPGAGGRHTEAHGSDNGKLGLPQEDLDEFTALGLQLKKEGKLYG